MPETGTSCASFAAKIARERECHRAEPRHEPEAWLGRFDQLRRMQAAVVVREVEERVNIIVEPVVAFSFGSAFAYIRGVCAAAVAQIDGAVVVVVELVVALER